MAKRKNKVIKKFAFFMLALVIIFVLLLGYFYKDFFFEVIYNSKNKENVMTEICENIDFKCETVNISANADIIKIDYISPGLDDYSLKTVIYSIKNSRVLFKNDFGTSDFSTGILNNEFYVARNTEKQVEFFDNNGNFIKTVTLTAKYPIADIAVDTSADNICYSQISDSKIRLYNIESNTDKELCSYSDYLSYSGYDSNTFYFANGSNGYIGIDALTEKCMEKHFDNSMRILSPYGCVVQSDVGYEIYKNEKIVKTLIPNKIDEVAMALSSERVFTASADESGDILTVYSLTDDKFATLMFNKQIYNVCDLQNGYSAVAVKTSTNSVPDIYLINLKLLDWQNSSTESEPVLTSDNSVSEKQLTDISKILNEVPVISQFPNFPTGCESVSAVIAMQYAGSNITVDEFVDNYLPKSSDFYFENGIKYGPDPYETFIGSPRYSNSYGCMAPVIENALKSYYGKEKNVLNLTGTTLEKLCVDYIDNDIPCIVWVSINMLEPYYSRNWTLPSGENFRWLANEHCLVLIGYDDENYYFSDPYNASIVNYRRELCEQRYKAFGSQAIAITN